MPQAKPACMAVGATHASQARNFSSYLGAWFPIMSKWNSRLIFFDGFAGPGIYQSAKLALRSLPFRYYSTPALFLIWPGY